MSSSHAGVEFYAGVYRECLFMTSGICLHSGPCKQDFLKSLATFKMCPLRSFLSVQGYFLSIPAERAIRLEGHYYSAL